MKPHIVRRPGITGYVWCCFVRGADGLPMWPLGHGYTPCKALEDWKAQQQ